MLLRLAHHCKASRIGVRHATARMLAQAPEAVFLSDIMFSSSSILMGKWRIVDSLNRQRLRTVIVNFPIRVVRSSWRHREQMGLPHRCRNNGTGTSRSIRIRRTVTTLLSPAAEANKKRGPFHASSSITAIGNNYLDQCFGSTSARANNGYRWHRLTKNTI